MKMRKEEEFIMALQTKVEASRRSKLGLKEEVVKKVFRLSNLAQFFNLKKESNRLKLMNNMA